MKVTEKMKDNFNIWTNLTKVINPALLITILILVFNGGKSLQRIEANSFDSQKDKIKTKEHIDGALTTVQIYQAFSRLKAVEDSVMEFKRTDSIVKSNSDKLNRILIKLNN